MTLPTSSDPHDLWEPDGWLRDVYVLNTTFDDWAVLLTLAVKHSYQYSHDGKDQALPGPKTIFSGHDRARELSVKVGGVTINCHFFVPEEIELDIDPREVLSDTHHYEVLRFLEALSIGTRKRLSVTAENRPETPYLSYEPMAKEWTIYQPPVQYK